MVRDGESREDVLRSVSTAVVDRMAQWTQSQFSDMHLKSDLLTDEARATVE